MRQRKTCESCGTELELTILEGVYEPLQAAVACECAEVPVGGIYLWRPSDWPDGW